MGTALTFRWSYIILPVVILLLSIILVAYFYQRLPAEVGYQFKPDGLPDRAVAATDEVLTKYPDIV